MLQRGPHKEPAAANEVAAARKPRGSESGRPEGSREVAKPRGEGRGRLRQRAANAGEERIDGVTAARRPRRARKRSQNIRREAATNEREEPTT